MTTTPTDLQRKQPAQVVTVQPTREMSISDKGRWVLPFVCFGLPLLFIVMVALGFVTTR